MKKNYSFYRLPLLVFTLLKNNNPKKILFINKCLRIQADKMKIKYGWI